MKILISGVAGFIGSALAKELLRREVQVVGAVRSGAVADRLLPGVLPALIETIDAKTDWSATLAGVDVVVHLAARLPGGVAPGEDLLAGFRQVNTAGAVRLAEMAARAGVRRFVFVSTAAAGDREDFGGRAVKKSKLSPAACYALSKMEAEQKLGELAQEAELDVVIIKPPGVYGADMKANFLRLFEIVDRGIPLPLASVDNRRSFIYLDNLVDALVRCCFHPNAGGQTFMVADGEDISTPELVRVIGKSLGRPVRLFPCPPLLLRAGGRICGVADNMERLLGSLRIDNTRIVSELNWQPPFSMAAGLRETAKWYLHQGRAGKRSGQAAEDK